MGKKEERIDRIQRKYVKWILGLDRRTPNYILMEETKMKELSMEAMKRAIKYEEKARKSNRKIVVECIKEMERRKMNGEESKWERNRKKVREKAEISEKKLKEMRQEEGTERIVKETLERIARKEEEERKKKIEESNYNKIKK